MRYKKKDPKKEEIFRLKRHHSTMRNEEEELGKRNMGWCGALV